MYKKCVSMLFINQCKKCKNVITHSRMKEIHIKDITYCPYCGHKLNKNGQLIDLTEVNKNE